MADYTPETWAMALLKALNMPTTKDNLGAIIAWETAEGGHWHNSDKYNPLNTTQPMPGAHSTNSAGVKAYVSWDQGLQATVKTLQNGRYGGILNALKDGKSADKVRAAILQSPWGTKHIGGPVFPGKIPGLPGSGGGLPGLPSLDGITKPFTELADAFESFGKIMNALLLPSTWIRIAAGWLGMIFVFFAIALFGMTVKKGST